MITATQCAWCKKWRVGDIWMSEIPDGCIASNSHSICRDCAIDVIAEFVENEMLKTKKGASDDHGPR